MKSDSDPRVILAIDTSTRIQALALVVEGEQIARRHHHVRTNHAATLLRNVSDILDQHGLEVADIDLVAVGIGPGSFTGLRVGLANAKALARAATAPIVGVSTLASMARPVGDVFRGYVVPVLDARRGEVYTATFRATDDGVSPIDETRAATPEAVCIHVNDLSETEPVMMVGNGIRAYSELAEWQGNAVRTLSSGWDSPSPFSIAMLGLTKLRSEGADDLVSLEPDYIRLSDAEIAWKARNTAS